MNLHELNPKQTWLIVSGMALTLLLRSKLLPGVTAPIPHPRITDDKFVLHIDVKDESQLDRTERLIRNSGASEVLLRSLQFA